MVDVHLTTVIGAVHEASKQGCLALAGRIVLDIPTDSLHIIKGFLVDNGLMDVLKNCPFAFINVMTFLVLEMLAGFEIDGMP